MACQTRSAKKNHVQINIDSILDNQIKYLQTQELELEKESRINSTINTSDLKVSEVNWINELETFRSISIINKPTYADRFKIETGPDPKSNLMIKSWIATEELPLKMVKIYYLEPVHQIKKLEVEMHQTNFIYSSNRKLGLHFSSLGSKPALEKYEVTGIQKFFWEEPQQYSLKGIVHLK